MSRTFRLTNLHHQVQRLAHGMRGAVSNKSATPGIRFYQSFFTQRLHGLAHRCTAHAKTLRQIAFRGKLIPRLERTLENGFFDLLDDLLVESRCSNELVHCRAPRTIWSETGRATDRGPVI